MAIDYTRDELSILIDLIRRDNANRVLTSAQATFGYPNVITPSAQFPRNTLIIGTAIPGRGYTGSQSFYYNRIPLRRFVETGITDLSFTITDEVMLSDLLDEINARLNIRLTKDKIQDVELPSLETRSSATVELQVTFDSLCFLDSLVLTLVPELIPLNTYYPITQLKGLTYSPPTH